MEFEGSLPVLTRGVLAELDIAGWELSHVGRRSRDEVLSGVVGIKVEHYGTGGGCVVDLTVLPGEGDGGGGAAGGVMP